MRIREKKTVIRPRVDFNTGFIEQSAFNEDFLLGFQQDNQRVLLSKDNLVDIQLAISCILNTQKERYPTRESLQRLKEETNVVLGGKNEPENWKFLNRALTQIVEYLESLQ